jgi:hypothetical protein
VQKADAGHVSCRRFAVAKTRTIVLQLLTHFEKSRKTTISKKNAIDNSNLKSSFLKKIETKIETNNSFYQ